MALGLLWSRSSWRCPGGQLVCEVVLVRYVHRGHRQRALPQGPSRFVFHIMDQRGAKLWALDVNHL